MTARQMLRGLAVLALGAALAGIALSFAGALHPAGDSLGVIRFELSLAAVLLSLLLLGLGHRRAAALGLLAGAVAGGPIAAAMLRAPGDGGLTLYQKNLWAHNGRLAGVVADIRASGADLVTLQEVNPDHWTVIEGLADLYPVRMTCPETGRQAVAILSRWEIAPGGVRCGPGRPGDMIALQVESPAGPLWVVALHLSWPWPYSQSAQVERMLPLLERLDGPVVVAGDFNMVPWSHAVGRIAAATGSDRTGRVERTFDFGNPLVRLRIDHVLLPGGWEGGTELRPLLGSDHFGVLARFGPARG